jgi:CHAT domain-containing protein/tetratricopeptide (TPR) repeat protein
MIPRPERLGLNDAFAQYVELERQGRYREAEPFARAALRASTREFGYYHANTGILLNNVAELLREQARQSEAERLYQEALAVFESTVGEDHDEFANTLNNLALCYEAQEKTEEAEAAFLRAVWIQKRPVAANPAKYANTLFNLGRFYYARHRDSESESALRQALAIFESVFGRSHVMTGRTLYELAESLGPQKRYGEAEHYFKEALQILQDLGETARVAQAWDGLAELYGVEVRAEDAVWANQEALAAHELAGGPEYPGVANACRRLAESLITLGLYEEKVQKLLTRSIVSSFAAWQQRQFGSLEVQKLLNSIEVLMTFLIRSGESQWPVLEKVHRSLMAEVNPNDKVVRATIMWQQARLASRRRLHDQALELFQSALIEAEGAFGKDSPFTALLLHSIAQEYAYEGDLAEAAATGARALHLAAKLYGESHHFYAVSCMLLAGFYRDLGRLDLSLQHSREFVAIVKAALLRFERKEVVSEFRDARFDDALVDHIDIFRRAVDAGLERREALVESAFEAAQLAVHGPAARSVWRLSARLATGDDNLAALIRERQDTLQRARTARERLIELASHAPAVEEPELERGLLTEIETANRRIEELDEQLAANYPAYSMSIQPSLLPLSEAQRLLEQDEALLAYIVGRSTGYLIAVRRDRAELFQLPTDLKAFREDVESLRPALDINLAPIPPFDLAAAFRIYQQVLAPAERFLEDATDLIVVPHAALVGLPLALILTHLPEEAGGTPDYRSCGWLAKRFGTTVLPCASSLRALRSVGASRRADLPFIGFGDPVLEGAPDPSEGRHSSPVLTGFATDAIDLRGLPRLVNTAEEVREVGRDLGADETALYLGPRATITNLKALDLWRYRVALFSTHGLMPGETEGVLEPALVFTPTGSDGGLLTASGVAQLRFDADWVILSACNSLLGVEGQSHLVNAFFYAGARALLVSHWQVDDVTTVKFITALFRQLARHPGLKRGEAVRRAALEIMNDQEDPELANPVFWAPFVLMGDTRSTVL